MTNIVPFGSDYVTLMKIADDLRVNPSQLRSWALKEGFIFAKMRTPESGGRLVLALSPEQAKALLNRRRELGFRV
jgi:hypothetical protein